MNHKNMIRALFQFLAFGIFVYQMKHSIEKYFEGPTMPQTSQTLVDEVTMPVLYACQDRQFNHAKGNYYGYDFQKSFIFGTLKGSNLTSWKGKYGNMTSTELLKELYEADYSKYSAFTKKMEINGKVIEQGNSNDILGNPWASVQAATRLTAQYGRVIPAGTYLLAGAATSAVFIHAQDHISTTVDKLGSLSFTAK